MDEISEIQEILNEVPENNNNLQGFSSWLKTTKTNLKNEIINLKGKIETAAKDTKPIIGSNFFVKLAKSFFANDSNENGIESIVSEFGRSKSSEFSKYNFKSFQKKCNTGSPQNQGHNGRRNSQGNYWQYSHTQSPRDQLCDILGLQPSATYKEVNPVYRRKCLELHSDKNKGDLNKDEQIKNLNSLMDQVFPYKRNRSVPQPQPRPMF